MTLNPKYVKQGTAPPRKSRWCVSWCWACMFFKLYFRVVKVLGFGACGLGLKDWSLGFCNHLPIITNTLLIINISPDTY